MHNPSQPLLDIDLLRSWIGRSESSRDQIHAARANALAATLDESVHYNDGDALPLLWHWLYFWSASPQSGLGADGHAQRGGFLPPVPLPRRMWAGGRLRFDAPLVIGANAMRSSRILDVTAKQGKSGALAFVTVAHQINYGDQPVIYEEHDIVYRDHPAPGAAAAPPVPAPDDAQWSARITPDPVWLFRYSALTFNGHRIHYDRSYATNVEGYPGLIVHGPLIATLLMQLLRTHCAGRAVKTFSFRALRPIFDIEPFSVHGRLDGDSKTVHTWAANARGELAMQAQASLID